MSEAREIHVQMCQLAIGSGSDVLRATLGSCVGIGLLWRERAIAGLAHCLLPGEGHALARREPLGVGARYVTQALPSLFKLMGVREAEQGELEAVLAGGANMVHYASAPRHASIGEQNVLVAQTLLDRLGVRIIHRDVGGECGRQLSIDCARQEFAVRIFNRSN